MNQKTQDDEFDDFLVGKGELAGLLKSMPQPTPSPELNQKIIQHVEQQTRKEQTAANDETQNIVPLRRSSISRWGMPVGMAACMLISVTLAYQYFGQTVRNQPAAIAMELPNETNASGVAASDHPQAELALIIQLIDNQQLKQAQAQWQAFQKNYPNYPLKEEMRKKLEPLENHAAKKK